MSKYRLVKDNMVLYSNNTHQRIAVERTQKVPKGFSPLLFPNERSAQLYIEATNMTAYHPEKVLSSEYVCPACGSELLIHWIEGADRTQSGMTERVCSCWNDECALEWRIYHTADGEFVKIERFFCG